MNRVVCVFAMAIALLVTGVASHARAQSEPRVKLVLQITVDGLRGDLLNRYGDRFGTGVDYLRISKRIFEGAFEGFNSGRVFDDCYLFSL